MKKAFKILLAILACAVLTFPLFAGCANSDAEYVDGSFGYDVTVYNGFREVNVNGSFEANCNSEGTYSVEYGLQIYYKQKLVATENCKSSVTVTDIGTKKVTVYRSVDITWDDSTSMTSKDYAVKICNVKITQDKVYDNSQGYAIGFGVTAAVLTCAITAYFVITKLSEKKKK